MQHTNTTSYLRSTSFLFLLFVLVVSSVPVAFADPVPQIPFPIPVPLEQPAPQPAQPIPQLHVVQVASARETYLINQPIRLVLEVRNTGVIPVPTQDIIIHTTLQRADDPHAEMFVDNFIITHQNLPETLASGSSLVYTLSHQPLNQAGNYDAGVSVSYVVGQMQVNQANTPRIPRIPGFQHAGNFLPPVPVPHQRLYEEIVMPLIRFRVVQLNSLNPINPVNPRRLHMPINPPVNPAPVIPVAPQQQNNDRGDTENAIDDAQDAMRRADCLIDVAEDDVRENYGHAEVRETTVRSAKQDLRRVGDLLDDAKDAKRNRNYDLAVDRAEDAEDEAEDIVRLLRRYYSCHLVDGGNDYDTRSGRYDDDYDYNYYNNQDDTSNDRSSSDQSNGTNRASNDDFLSAEHRQRLLDNLNQANQDTPTQNVAGGGAEGDQVIDVQRIPVLQQDRQSKTESPSPSLWGLGNMNSGFMVALAIAGLLLMLVEIVLAVQYFRK